ncbi:hypothetical protein [Methylotenera sp. N17]|nr:hypothetical protein [Methylotenera sp. N17]
MAKDKEQKNPLEKQLWKTADILRKNIDAAEHMSIPAKNATQNYFKVASD